MKVNYVADHMRRRRAGITLVEVIVGSAILVFLLASTFVSLYSLSIGNKVVSTKHKVNRLLDTTRSEFRVFSGDPNWFADAENLAPSTYPALSEKDPDILVTAIIGPIINNRREITITATWKVRGITQTKKQTFYISRIRTRLDGAQVYVKVIDENGDPVEGVVVTPFLPAGKGEVGVDGPIPAKTTDILGDVFFSGVRALDTGIKLLIDGRTVVHYFTNGTPSTARFSAEFTTSKTISGQQNRYFYTTTCAGCPGPIVMRAPGHIEGDVKHYVTGDPIQGAKVKIIAETMDLTTNEDGTPYFLSENQGWATSGANGRFRSLPLVKGNYFLVFVGNDEYAALGTPGDHHTLTSASSERVSVPAGGVIDIVTPKPSGGLGKIYRTVHRGSLSGTVKSVVWNSATQRFEVGVDSPAGMVLRFYQTQRIIKYKIGAATHEMNMTWAQAFRDHLFSEREFETFVTGTGAYDAPHFTPLIVHSNTSTHDPRKFFTTVSIRPFNKLPGTNPATVTVPDPMTTIMVKPVGGNFPRSKDEVMFLHVSHGGSDALPNRYVFTAPDTGGTAPVTVEDFEWDVYANQAGANNDLYFLDRQALSSVSGQLIQGPGMPVPNDPFDTTGLDGSTLKSMRGSEGYGAMRAQNWTNLDAVIFHPWGWKDSISTNYQFVNNTLNPSNGGRILIPTIGSDQMRLHYYGRDYSSQNKDFFGKVEGWQKVLDANMNYTYKKVHPSQMDMDILVRAYHVKSNYEWVPFSAANVAVTNGEFNEARDVRSLVEYRGNTNLFVATPGENTPNQDIVVTEHANQWEEYYLRVDHEVTGEWAPNEYPFEGDAGLGPVFHYDSGSDRYIQKVGPSYNDPDTGIPVVLSLLKKVEILVSGTLTDASDAAGRAVPNALVELIDYTLLNSDGNPDGVAATTYSLANGTFAFQDIRLLPAPNWNVRVRISHPQFQSKVVGDYTIYSPSNGSPWTKVLNIGLERNPNYNGGGQAGN